MHPSNCLLFCVAAVRHRARTVIDLVPDYYFIKNGLQVFPFRRGGVGDSLAFARYVIPYPGSPQVITNNATGEPVLREGKSLYR